MLFVWKQLCDFCCLRNLTNPCPFPWPEFSICLYVLGIIHYPHSSCGRVYQIYSSKGQTYLHSVRPGQNCSQRLTSLQLICAEEFEVSLPESMPVAVSIQESPGEPCAHRPRAVFSTCSSCSLRQKLGQGQLPALHCTLGLGNTSMGAVGNIF